MPTRKKDLGIGKLREQIAELQKTKILIGVQGEKAQEIHPQAKVKIGLLAFWLHYGTKRMPARPYVDRAIAMLRKRAYPIMKRAMSDLVDGRAKTVAESLAPLGAAGVEQVEHEIATSRDWAAPLAQATIDRKGHDQPLVETGVIRGATSYTIRVGETIIGSGGATGAG